MIFDPADDRIVIFVKMDNMQRRASSESAQDYSIARLVAIFLSSSPKHELLFTILTTFNFTATIQPSFCRRQIIGVLHRLSNSLSGTAPRSKNQVAVAAPRAIEEFSSRPWLLTELNAKSELCPYAIHLVSGRIQ